MNGESVQQGGLVGITDPADMVGAPSASAPTVGQQLRAAREAKGLSKGEAAKSIKLSVRQVEALEADDWDNLPCNTIVRGFVRNYARLLNLDAERLMHALDALHFPQAPELKVTTGTPVSMPQEGTPDRRDYARVIFGLLILAAAVAAYLFVPIELWQSTLTAVKSAMESRTATEEKLPPSQEAATANTPVVTAAPSVPEPAAVPANLPPLGGADTSAQLPESPAVADAAAEAQANVLKFSFAKPSWVEVRDKSGRVIFSQLNPEGSQKEVSGTPPFSLVVGNSAYVSLQYRNKPVDLSKRSKDDVARLTVE